IWYDPVWEPTPLEAAGPSPQVITPGGRASYVQGTYSIDPRMFDDRAELLLPRATAYSAGLLNYFFNPRLKIDLPPEGAYAVADHASSTGFTKVRLRATNSTAPLQDDKTAVPQHMFDGTVIAVAKYHVNT